MGTRAQFFIGNPGDLDNRQYFGTVAWDGYPDGDCGSAFKNVTTEKGFKAAITRLSNKRRDFADPKDHAFPFPWKDNLFLTDCTYAFFNGAVQFTWFHRGFVPLTTYLAFTEEEMEAYGNEPDQLPDNVPAPTSDLAHREEYPDPTTEMLEGDPLFEAIWQAIKGWDISRHNDGLYSGPTGNDARHIYDAIKRSGIQ